MNKYSFKKGKHTTYALGPCQRQLLCRDPEQILHTQLLCNTTASSPLRCVSSELKEGRYQRSVVFGMILSICKSCFEIDMLASKK